MTTPSPKSSGDPSAKALASGLATLGRYGDEYIVHAARRGDDDPQGDF